MGNYLIIMESFFQTRYQNVHIEWTKVTCPGLYVVLKPNWQVNSFICFLQSHYQLILSRRLLSNVCGEFLETSPIIVWRSLTKSNGINWLLVKLNLFFCWWALLPSARWELTISKTNLDINVTQKMNMIPKMKTTQKWRHLQKWGRP